MTPTAPRPEDGHHAPVADAVQTRRAAVRLIRADRASFAAMIALNVAATLAGLAGPWLLGRIIDTVTAGGGLGTVDLLALLIVVAAVVQLLLIRWAGRVAARFGERASARIREDFLDRVLRLPAAVVDRISRGDLAARGSADVTAVATTMRDALPELLIAATQTLFILVAVVVVDPVLGLCGLAMTAGGWIAGRWYLRRAPEAYLAVGAANSEIAEMVTTTVAGARTIDALGLGERRMGAGAAVIEHAGRTRERALRLRTVLFPALDLSTLLPIAAVLLVGGVMVNAGSLTLGAVVTAALYLRQLSGPVDTLSLWIDQAQSSWASFARIVGVDGLASAAPAETPRGDRDGGSTTRLRETGRRGGAPRSDLIVVDDVRYAYARGGDVLRGIDLEISAGERVAMVGPSGAGKSTLGRLLAGIDTPRSGSVTVGGVPVGGLSAEDLRRQVLLVTQEHHVFEDTLRDNLRMADPSASDADLLDAMQLTGAGWVEALPDGLGTMLLGATGARLDAAQAQQVALARVVLADPHTVILDEATAMLDPTTARRAERALGAVLAGRAVVAIAHRLHTAVDADRIIVLEDGVVSESGTHLDLVDAGGVYARLWRAWHPGGAGLTG